jgi:ABC-type sugar transport system ATPase subunit
LVELARALATTARVLILDEPTAVLSLAEQEKLFKVIASLRSSGLLILYISHRLEEVFAIADRVSVMRDGRLVATHDKAGLSHSELVGLMTGRQLQQNIAPAALARDAKPILTLSGEGVPEKGLIIAAGEIFGFVGLVGAGRTWLARRIAGLSPRVGLRVNLNGASLPGDAHAALTRGVVYLTEDRKVSGIFAPLAITANATAASLRRFTRAGVLARRREKREASQLLKDLQLVAASLDAAISGLSGGNQQKVLIARALLAAPKVLICDEPTRGVDVGAKEEIYKILRNLAARGVAVIVISSEFNELLALCHRLAVVKGGRIIATLDNENLDERRLLEVATGPAAST